MPRLITDESLFSFPDVAEADEEGLLVIGGRPTPERILDGYRKGVFPWYDNDALPLWWSPDPRFVLLPDELRVNRSTERFLQKTSFAFTVNADFNTVVDRCRHVPRSGQAGTWITEGMVEAYTSLHQAGWAHSAEAWQDGRIVGGVYGVRVGAAFFAESMFRLQPNASKFALVLFVQRLAAEGIMLIDCQVYTPHLAGLGAKHITRAQYLSLLKRWCPGGINGSGI